MTKSNFNIVRNLPVAKFFYRGTHERPVKRTVLITEQTDRFFKGLEIRQGNEVRDLEDAPVKTYNRNSIAMTSQLRSDNPRKNNKDETTLERMSLSELVETGV